ncbi:MAG: DUF1465 family protein [Hyphomicrobiaceae bacterium]|jgi:regulator of CtrA degradation
MSTRTQTSDAQASSCVTISFGERYAQSEQFEATFKEGMALVERTASYLDGTGRKEARLLKSPLTMVYATESMRLTTRLLELASWLMIRRALKDGEITEEEAKVKRERVRLNTLGRPSHVKGFSELPQGLKDLVDASFALNDRIVQLDRAMQVVIEPAEAPAETAAANPVGAQVLRLESAFSGHGRRARRI